MEDMNVTANPNTMDMKLEEKTMSQTNGNNTETTRRINRRPIHHRTETNPEAISRPKVPKADISPQSMSLLEKVSNFKFDNIYDVLIAVFICNEYDDNGFISMYFKEFGLEQLLETIEEVFDYDDNSISYSIFEVFGFDVFQHRIKNEKANYPATSRFFRRFIDLGIPFIKNYDTKHSNDQFSVDELLKRFYQLLAS